MKLLTFLILMCAGFAVAQNSGEENMVRDRGQTPVADPSQTVNRGRIGSQGSVPLEPLKLYGLLEDAGCRDRSARNFRQAPGEPALATVPPPEKRPQANSSAEAAAQTVGGASVIASERTDAMEHQVLDLRNRQMDPACAITGSTSGFVLFTGDGRLLALDEGGNTRAAEAIRSTPAGRQMLNGTGAHLKPVAEVTGRIRGDRLIVDSLQLERNAPAETNPPR